MQQFYDKKMNDKLSFCGTKTEELSSPSVVSFHPSVSSGVTG